MGQFCIGQNWVFYNTFSFNDYINYCHVAVWMLVKPLNEDTMQQSHDLITKSQVL